MLKFGRVCLIIAVLGLLISSEAAPMNPNHPHDSESHLNDDFWGAPFQMSTSPQAAHPSYLFPATFDHLALGHENNYPADVHDMNAPWPEQAHHLNFNLQHAMHYGGNFDPSINVYNQHPGHILGSSQPSEHGASSSVPVEIVHEDPVQKQRRRQKGKSSSDIPRPFRLREYNWQINMDEKSVENVYKIIAMHWVPAHRNTNLARIEKVGSYLEKHHGMAERILNNDKEAILEVAEHSRSRERKDDFGARPSNPRDVREHIRICLLPLYGLTRTESPKRKHPSWADQGMSKKEQDIIVDILHEAWMADRATVKSKLLKFNVEEFHPFKTRLLSNNPLEVQATADQVEQIFKQKKGNTMSMARDKRQETIRNKKLLKESEQNYRQHHQEEQNHQFDEQYFEQDEDPNQYHHGQYHQSQYHHSQENLSGANSHHENSQQYNTFHGEPQLHYSHSPSEGEFSQYTDPNFWL